MERKKNINIIVIVKSYLIKKGLIGHLLDEYTQLQTYDEINDFDSLLSNVGKSQACCIIADTNTLRKFERYFHNLPENSVLIPLIESPKYLERYSNFKSIISLNDDKRKITETVQRTVESLKVHQPQANSVNELTERETVILQLIAGGCSSKLIADKLNISIQTVSTHRKNISAKLGIKSVSGLTVYAIINNLIKPEETGLN